MTVTSRRTLLASALTTTAAIALGSKLFPTRTNLNNTTLFLSACDDKHGNHCIGAWSLTGQQHVFIPVTQRAHDSCCSPDNTLGVFFARRPGTRLYIVDLINARLHQTIKAKAGYHFYGHGVFSSDGRYLLVTENHFQARSMQHSGIVAIYETQDLNRGRLKPVAQYHSGGIGPHQLAFLNDGYTLAIANGGIATHPDQQRKKLNLDTMQPSLTYLDSRNGKIVDQFYPPHHQMSIRHLAVSANDQIIMGIQYEGDPHDLQPLVLSHKGEAQLQAMQAHDRDWRKQQHYIASIAIHHNARLAISTSPRGNTVNLWDLSTLEHLDQLTVRDVAGATFLPHNNSFLISNGNGQLMVLPTTTPTLSAQTLLNNHTVHWDNHLSLNS